MKALVAILLVMATAAITPRFTPVGALVGDCAADTSFTVTNFGSSAYRIDGVNNRPLTLFRGQTVIFNVSAVGHPFYIKVLPTTGDGERYDDGVTGQGVTQGQLTFVIPNDAPDELYYHCSLHSSMGGTITIATPVGVPGLIVPKHLWLKPATPNPAREDALISFGLPRAARVDLAVFDSRGRRIREIVRGSLPAGEHVMRWDGRDGAGKRVPNGLYFYRLEADGRRLSGRVVMTH